MKTFLVVGGECPRRKVDAQTVYNYFVSNGLKSVNKINLADIIYICSCGAFKTSEDKSILTVDKVLSKKKENSFVIIGDCLTGINPKSLDSKDVIQIPYPMISELDRIINAKYKYKSLKDANIIHGIPGLFSNESIIDKIYKNLQFNPSLFIKANKYLKWKLLNKLPYSEDIFGKDIYNIMISRGCRGNCSHCAIKYAHGALQSKSLNVVLEHLK